MSTKPAAPPLLSYDPVKSLPLKQTGASAKHRVTGDVTSGIARMEMSTSVSRVLFTLVMAFLFTNGIIWVFVKYWLFAP